MKLPTLHLHLKAEYFDAIDRGEKTEEFRLHTAYWVKRLVIFPTGSMREFAGITLYRGYPKRGDKSGIMHRPWRGWRLTGITHPHFGPEEVTVFAIRVN